MQAQIKQFLYWSERYGLLLFCGIWLLFALVWASRIIFADEAMMGVAILESGLSPFEPLTRYDQATTYGMHVLTYWVTSIFGYGNMIIRLPVLLTYFLTMVVLSDFLKKQYGFLVAFTVLFMMLINASLLRYATEFKHYGFEISFTVLLLVTYIQYRHDKSRGHLIRYLLLMLIGIFFGISTLLVVTSIFVVESLLELQVFYQQTAGKWSHRLIEVIKSYIRTPFVVIHMIYYGVFLAWYIISIRPSTYYQITNYAPPTVTLNQVLSLDYWLHTLKLIAWGLIGQLTIVPLLILLVMVLYFIFHRKYRLAILALIFLSLYFVIHILNIIGIYPILSARQLLFIAPIVYLLIAEVLAQLLKWKILLQIISAFMIIFSSLNMMFYYSYSDIWDFKLPEALEEIQPSDTVFVHLTGQPIYDWYKSTHYPDLPEQAEPVIGSETGSLVPYEDMIAELEGNMGRSGAWGSVIHITYTAPTDVYDDYFIQQVMSVEQSKIFNYWTLDWKYRELLDENCDVTPLGEGRIWIAEVSCPIGDND